MILWLKPIGWFCFQSYKLAVELKPDQSQAWMNMGGIQHIKVGGKNKQALKGQFKYLSH